MWPSASAAASTSGLKALPGWRRASVARFVAGRAAGPVPVATPDECTDRAAAGLRGDERRRRVGGIRQHLADGLLRGPLPPGAQRRLDPQTVTEETPRSGGGVGAQDGEGVVVLQQAQDVVDEVRSAPLLIGRRRHRQRRGVRTLGVLPADQLLGRHRVEDHVSPVAGALGRSAGVVAAGVVEESREQGRLCQVEVVDVDVEVGAGGGLHPVRPAAEVHGVEVPLEDLLLGEALLELQRDARLRELAVQGQLVACDRVLRQLLRDGRPALRDPPLPGVAVQRPRHGPRVDPTVVEEAGILHGDDSVTEHPGHALEPHDVAVLLRVQPGEHTALVVDDDARLWRRVERDLPDGLDPDQSPAARGGEREHDEQRRESRRSAVRGSARRRSSSSVVPRQGLRQQANGPRACGTPSRLCLGCPARLLEWPQRSESGAYPAVMKDADEQLRILTRGVAEIQPYEEFVARIRAAAAGERPPLRVKFGIDPTSTDLHVGHAVVFRKLAEFQRLGHTAVLIIGGFTAQVGDPSGRSKTRPHLTPEQVTANARTYLEQVRVVLEDAPLEITDNRDWLAGMTLSDVLGLTSQLTVARMLERADFAERYASRTPIAISEFLYPLLQARDSVAVRADVELGGTDQTFNLMAGRGVQQAAGQEPQSVLTMPLLEGLDGSAKMSKSLGNTIGVTDEPGDMYGKVMRLRDELIAKYLELATDVRGEEVDALAAALERGELHPRDAKRRLAREVVTLYHGGEAAESAEARFDRQFREHGVPDDVPTVPIGERASWPLPELLERAGLVASRSEARRQVAQGGVRLDGEQLHDPVATLSSQELRGKVLQVGRRRFARLRSGTG